MPGENTDDSALSTQQDIWHSFIEILDKLSTDIWNDFSTVQSLHSFVNASHSSNKEQLSPNNIKCTVIEENIST